VFLDIESTIATGLPPIIHRTGYTTQLPSPINDGTISLGAGFASVLTPGDFSPMMIAMQGHFQWAQTMQAWFEKLPSQDELDAFRSLLNGLIDLLPDNSDPNNRWARLYLQMQVDRVYCMLGPRFWQPDQYKGIGCHSEVVK
jgi:hypothetical protein